MINLIRNSSKKNPDSGKKNSISLFTFRQGKVKYAIARRLRVI